MWETPSSSPPSTWGEEEIWTAIYHLSGECWTIPLDCPTGLWDILVWGSFNLSCWNCFTLDTWLWDSHILGECSNQQARVIFQACALALSLSKSVPPHTHLKFRGCLLYWAPQATLGCPKFYLPLVYKSLWLSEGLCSSHAHVQRQKHRHLGSCYWQNWGAERL